MSGVRNKYEQPLVYRSYCRYWNGINVTGPIVSSSCGIFETKSMSQWKWMEVVDQLFSHCFPMVDLSSSLWRSHCQRANMMPWDLWGWAMMPVSWGNGSLADAWWRRQIVLCWEVHLVQEWAIKWYKKLWKITMLFMGNSRHSDWAIFHSYTPHFTLHTLYTLNIPLYTLHSTLYTLNSTHHHFNFTLSTPHSTVHSPHSPLHTLHFTLHTPDCTLHTTLYT